VQIPSLPSPLATANFDAKKENIKAVVNIDKIVYPETKDFKTLPT
jgi:hypothetical protein